MKYHIANNEIVRKYTIKEIFKTNDNWYRFVAEMAKQNKSIRPVILREVQKIMDCQDPKKGFALYICPKCNTIKHVFFTCKSRFCNCCGAKYSKDRALSISAKLLDCSHRHVVFTIPEELRKYFAIDRSLLNLLFQASANAIFYCFSKRSKSQNYIPGLVSVLHTFGRDLKWNPHIHMILSEDAVGNFNSWLSFNHINYESLRRSWQYSLLSLLLDKIDLPSFKKVVDALYLQYKDGFYVNSPPIKNFSSGVVNYIVRYAGRPVLAQSRITNFDGDFVSFNYTPHGSDLLVEETIPAFDFFKKLIIHIPDENFKMIRYFGFYCVTNAKYKQYLLREKRITASMLNTLKDIHRHWRKRISYYFRYDPLKCLCGAYLDLIEIFVSPRKIKFYSDFTGRDTS